MVYGGAIDHTAALPEIRCTRSTASADELTRQHEAKIHRREVRRVREGDGYVGLG